MTKNMLRLRHRLYNAAKRMTPSPQRIDAVVLSPVIKNIDTLGCRKIVCKEALCHMDYVKRLMLRELADKLLECGYIDFHIEAIDLVTYDIRAKINVIEPY